MKRLRLTDLHGEGSHHFLKYTVGGAYLSEGGLSFKKPGQRTHDRGCTCPSCDGHGRHIHADHAEVFVILQGKARMEVDGKSYGMTTGDVIVCEPGEDHHLVADETIRALICGFMRLIRATGTRNQRSARLRGLPASW